MKKKKYEKPQVKGEKLFEVGAKSCCKGGGDCDKTMQSNQGKGFSTQNIS
ncbi:MAG: hypothetical protein JW788_01005 [Candidatus Omnitrophica bacterium]|nr:hypothetical protein [Candidatus Omnitrophota bacterium]